MLLHRYLGSHIEDTILNQRLKVSKPSEFNDPFEFRFKSSDITIEDLRAWVTSNPSAVKRLAPDHLNPLGILLGAFDLIDSDQSQRESLLESMKDTVIEISKDIIDSRESVERVVCFNDPSKIDPFSEILLWSHYTNNHRGARIELDTDKLPIGSPLKELCPVKYKENLPSMPLLNSTNAEIALSAAEIKSRAWEYEHEVRCFVDLDKTQFSAGETGILDFIELPNICVTGIDFGIRFSRARRDQLISRLNAIEVTGIRFRQATPSSDLYKIEYEDLA